MQSLSACMQSLRASVLALTRLDHDRSDLVCLDPFPLSQRPSGRLASGDLLSR